MITDHGHADDYVDDGGHDDDHADDDADDGGHDDDSYWRSSNKTVKVNIAFWTLQDA